MAYIKSKKKGFWLKCDFSSCVATKFFFSNKDAYSAGWRMWSNGGKKKHLCPECVKFIQAGQI